ncbi:MAG: hypothetical protein IJE14_06855 [Clostridia bacterium]|nr:hypothetical protein [Clostridia bacterium]
MSEKKMKAVVKTEEKGFCGDYADMRRKVYALKEKYPFACCTVGARSWGGRAIFTLGLGQTQGATLYTGCVNACDGETAFALLRLYENMCRAVDGGGKLCGIKLNEIFKSRGVIIVPCVNPDGMEIRRCGAVAAGCYAGLAQRLSPDGFENWRANAAGVDLSRNTSDNWRRLKETERSVGYTSPGARFYGGKTCFSEPESRAVASLCRKYGVRHIVDVRRGNNALYVTGGECEEKGALMAKILRLCSGLEKAERSGALDEERGFCDWFAAEYGRAAFSLEYEEYCVKNYPSFEEAAVVAAIM